MPPEVEAEIFLYQTYEAIEAPLPALAVTESAGVEAFAQTVCAAVDGWPTIAGEETVIVAVAEFAAGHTLLVTTALNEVVVARVPIVAPVKVADVELISVDDEKLFVDFCHFVIVPVYPLNTRFAGVLPEQIA